VCVWTVCVWIRTVCFHYSYIYIYIYEQLIYNSRMLVQIQRLYHIAFHSFLPSVSIINSLFRPHPSYPIPPLLRSNLSYSAFSTTASPFLIFSKLLIVHIPTFSFLQFSSQAPPSKKTFVNISQIVIVQEAWLIDWLLYTESTERLLVPRNVAKNVMIKIRR